VTRPFVRSTALIAFLLSATVAGSICAAASSADSADTEIATAQAIVVECSEADSDAVGLTALQEDCPGLEHALVELGYAPFIAEQQADTLTVHGLADLLALTRRYSEPSRADVAPDVGRLAPILDSLQRQQHAQVPQGWFARFKQWLRDLFEQQASQKSGDTWFKRWWSEHSLSQRWVSLMTYGLIGLVLLLAVAVIVNEIRAGRIKDGRRHRVNTADGAAVVEIPKFTLAGLDSVAPALRPALMLQALVNTLVEAGRLRADRSLTHRELGLRATFDSAEQRDGFRHIAGLGERLLYSAMPASTEEIDAAMATGRMLRAQLAVPAPSPPEATP